VPGMRGKGNEPGHMCGSGYMMCRSGEGGQCGLRGCAGQGTMCRSFCRDFEQECSGTGEPGDWWSHHRCTLPAPSPEHLCSKSLQKRLARPLKITDPPAPHIVSKFTAPLPLLFGGQCPGYMMCSHNTMCRTGPSDRIGPRGQVSVRLARSSFVQLSAQAKA
jgi:hypothetical protein